MRTASTIALFDLRQMLREKETLLWLFAMPFVFFWFLGTVTSGFGAAADRRDALGLLAPADAGFLADRLARRLHAEGFEVHRTGDAAALLPFARRLEVPAGFTSKVQARMPAQLVWWRESAQGPGADFDGVRVRRAVYTLLADTVAVGVTAGELSEAALAAFDAQPRTITLAVAPAGARQRIPTGFEQAIPGTMVMFTLTILLTGGGVPLVVERRLGLLRRLASAPLTRGQLVAGKALARLLLAAVQIAFGVAIGTWVFGMRWGPDLPMVLVVLAAWGALCAMLGLLCGNIARTEGQAVGIGILSAMALAALGGCWWPIEITPPWLQQLARVLPTGWTMDAIHQLVSFQNGAAAALWQVLLLLAAAGAAGFAAARTFRYQG